jgi:uncharacterized protein (UPF0264 family)
MSSMAEALRKAGLVTDETSKEVLQRATEKERSQVGNNIGHLKGKPVSASLMNIETVKTVTEFKKVARQILLEDNSAEVMAEVVRLAHNLKDFDGGKKLVWLILSLRDNLGQVKPEYRKRLIMRALRSSTPTTEVPPDWREK